MNNSQQSIKVPQITASFWVLTILLAGLGEGFSDYMGHTFHQLAFPCAGLALIIILAIQNTIRHYNAVIYWLAFFAASVFGTMIADLSHGKLGVPLVISTCIFLTIQIIIMVTWRISEENVSFFYIVKGSSEAFYWATVLCMMALGTAAGDLAANPMRLGFLNSGLLFCAVMAIATVSNQLFKSDETIVFWIIYILARPFSASFSDWLAASPARSGLGLGAGTASLIFAVLVAISLAACQFTAIVKRKTG